MATSGTNQQVFFVPASLAPTPHQPGIAQSNSSHNSQFSLVDPYLRALPALIKGVPFPPCFNVCNFWIDFNSSHPLYLDWKDLASLMAVSKKGREYVLFFAQVYLKSSKDLLSQVAVGLQNRLGNGDALLAKIAPMQRFAEDSDTEILAGTLVGWRVSSFVVARLTGKSPSQKTTLFCRGFLENEVIKRLLNVDFATALKFAKQEIDSDQRDKLLKAICTALGLDLKSSFAPISTFKELPSSEFDQRIKIAIQAAELLSDIDERGKVFKNCGYLLEDRGCRADLERAWEISNRVRTKDSQWSVRLIKLQSKVELARRYDKNIAESLEKGWYDSALKYAQDEVCNSKPHRLDEHLLEIGKFVIFRSPFKGAEPGASLGDQAKLIAKQTAQNKEWIERIMKLVSKTNKSQFGARFDQAMDQRLMAIAVILVSQSPFEGVQSGISSEELRTIIKYKTQQTAQLIEEIGLQVSELNRAEFQDRVAEALELADQRFPEEAERFLKGSAEFASLNDSSSS